MQKKPRNKRMTKLSMQEDKENRGIHLNTNPTQESQSFVTDITRKGSLSTKNSKKKIEEVSHNSFRASETHLTRFENFTLESNRTKAVTSINYDNRLLRKPPNPGISASAHIPKPKKLPIGKSFNTTETSIVSSKD